MTDIVKIENFERFLNEVSVRCSKSDAAALDTTKKLRQLPPDAIDRAKYESLFNSILKNEAGDASIFSKLKKK